jgi:hypothetical protein
LQKGKKKRGEHAKALTIARNVLAVMNDTQIANMTGLTIKVISEL